MSVKLDQALLQAFIDGAFGLPIAQENDGYTPTPGTAYVELEVMKNSENAFTLNDLNDNTGLLQVAFNYPTGEGAIAAKDKRDEVSDAFPIGEVLTYAGQSLQITGKQTPKAAPRAGWYRLLLRINFVAYLPR